MSGQRLEHLSDTPVDRLDDVPVESSRGLPAELAGRVDGEVGHGIRDVQEERLRLSGIALDERDRLICLVDGQGVLVDRMRDDLSATVKCQRFVRLYPRPGVIVRVRQAEPVVEALIWREELLLFVPEMPLADHGRRITSALESLCQRHLAIGQSSLPVCARLTAELD